ncbi:non-ribosomal peptide synthetase-like protein [Kibdelosporangium banguiense]|uniref:Non-ribosomal peptide synthetase-like protein n=1 Tax=Kibdelosporangium banguiense TaxID=1365924 RepID=A0ABS4TVE4_9PSEU|nr:non-ribosomal peptide synthetase [Kibdelosporangium banguiense]MBP2328386.1 non-ribosomal peptide synthetase-like protein [Kibdelosporangium banguiense]
MTSTVQSPPISLYSFFERAAQRWPEAIAVDIPPATGRPERSRTTYRDLLRKTGVAAGIFERILGRGRVISILLPRTSDSLYAAQLAVLKSGSAHVCVDPSFPDDQLTHILSDSGARVLVTDALGAKRATRIGYQGTIVRVDGPLAELRPVEAPRAPDGLAYLIYTSGTTGRPKGVMIGHAGISNLIGSDLAEFSLGPGDRVAQGSSAAYDSSVEEVWMALSSGATVVVMDDETVRLGPDAVPWLRDERITVFCPPPTLLRAAACPDPQAALPDLRLLYVGGEALPDDVAELWSRGRRMVNGYGPTECTVTCLRQDIVAGQPIAIGRAVPGMQAWVLDENLTPVAAGQRGELCMAGAGLAIGYHNQPGLSAEKFPDHPALGRIYRTGDLVHAEPDGTLFYHGRIDSQVKVRGYRIELEAIETSLARCDGVREAACRVQGDGPAQAIAAHIIPVDPMRPPPVDSLKTRLRTELPGYMVPALFGVIDDLPRSAGGKLRRTDLPVLTLPERRRGGVAAADPVEKAIAQAVGEVFGLADGVSVRDDFFNDLGGTSLQAAILISKLRTNPATDTITVRDVYEARTVTELARRARPATPVRHEPAPMPVVSSARDAAKVTAIQTAWIVLELILLAPVAYLVTFKFLPWLAGEIGLLPLVLLVPFVLVPAGLAWTPIAVFVAVRLKKILIGRYQPVRAPAWSGLRVRVWIVQHMVRLIPWRTIAGTEFQCMALRALGARIGKRVHIHRGVNLTQGGWDLLDIGDDVTLSQDAHIGLVQFEHGQLVIGPVRIDSGATVDIRAGLGPGTRMGRDSWLAPLSSLPAGRFLPDSEMWDGVPARLVGPAPQPPDPVGEGSVLSPVLHGIAMMVCRTLMAWVLAVPATVLMVGVILRYQLTFDSVLVALTNPLAYLPFFLSIAVLVCVTLIVTLVLEALAARALGRVTDKVISRWSPAYIRIWLKSGLVESAGRWLSGGLYWPVWLRWAGMKVGRGCEISTIIDVVPELVHIGPDTFFADGIYLGGPRIQQGTVALAGVRISERTFLGNHAVIAGGQRLPSDILIGISTVADDRVIRPGSSWFGHPAFELPQREVVTVDRSLTHKPSLIRRVNRLFWEWLRFVLPVVPLAVMVAWFWGIALAVETLPYTGFLVIGAAAVTFGAALLPCLIVLAMKWLLLGKVRPGVHPLWSCWCSRWDFLYVAWGVIASGALAAVEGTLLLAVYLRRMGMKIGKRVVLGDGFAQVVDPDMLHFGDGATVNAMFQAHTFEDRVLKIDRVTVGAHSTLANATVPLYGADIGTGTYVAPHSVVMKHEHLLPNLRYEGAPTRA